MSWNSCCCDVDVILHFSLNHVMCRCWHFMINVKLSSTSPTTVRFNQFYHFRESWNFVMDLLSVAFNLNVKLENNFIYKIYLREDRIRHVAVGYLKIWAQFYRGIPSSRNLLKPGSRRWLRVGQSLFIYLQPIPPSATSWHHQTQHT